MADAINNQLLEIRFKPNSKMLDYRGAWADAIAEVMEYQHWKVDANRIDVWDEDNGRMSFVSFRNAGFGVRNVATKNYFSDHASKLLKLLFRLEGFEKKPFIERIGVRSRFCTPFEGEFEDLVRKYECEFLGLSKPAKDVLKSKILDIGSPLVLEDNLGKINFMGGPMDLPQITQFFGLLETDIKIPPKVGLVFDIDYWSSPMAEITENELVEKVKGFADACWAMCGRLNQLILR